MHTLSDNAARELLATCPGETPAWMERVLNGEGSREDWVEAKRSMDRRWDTYFGGDRPSGPSAKFFAASIEVNRVLLFWGAP